MEQFSHDSDYHADIEEKQRKKRKKEKREKATKSVSIAATEPRVSAQEVPIQRNEGAQDTEKLNEEHTEFQKPKEPKRHKKRKQQDVTDEEQPPDPKEEAKRKKHDAIFAKYQRAAELAEAERAKAPPIAEDDPMDIDTPDAAAAPELHGGHS